MNRIIFSILLLFASAGFAAPELVYWNSDAGKILRARISPDADYWPLSATFVLQNTQTYCSVASAVTVLNAMPIRKPVDPVYAPTPYFTQRNFFTPEVNRIITPDTVLNMGMTRDQMAGTLQQHGVRVENIAGDTLSVDALRSLLKTRLGDDGRFVLANYLRSSLGQEDGGHWSALAAFDVASDRVLILDVARYKYPPTWVDIGSLRRAIATLDSTSNKPRGLIIVSQ